MASGMEGNPMSNRLKLHTDVVTERRQREEHIEAAKKPGHLAELIAKLNAMREKSHEQGSTVQPEEPKKVETSQVKATQQPSVTVTEAMLRDARRNEWRQKKLLGDDFE